MFEILSVVSLYVWLVVLVELTAICFFVESKNGRAATASVVIFICLLQFLMGVDIYGAIKSNPSWLIWGAIGYIITGLCWGGIKWKLFSRECRFLYDNFKADFLKNNGVVVTGNPRNVSVPVELQAKFKEKVLASRYPTVSPMPPQANDFKVDIIRWSSWWFASFISWLLSDFIRGIFTAGYHLIASTLQYMADREFAGVANDFPDPTEIKKQD